MPLVSRSAALELPASTDERLEVPWASEGYPDPTTLAAEWQLSAAAVNLSQQELIDPLGWAPAGWYGTTSIQTGRITGRTPGNYGMWVRVTVGDERPVRYAGHVVLH